MTTMMMIMMTSYNDDRSVEDGDLAGTVSEDPLDTTKTGFASVGTLLFPNRPG